MSEQPIVQKFSPMTPGETRYLSEFVAIKQFTSTDSPLSVHILIHHEHFITPADYLIPIVIID
jgi:hypothetical protein